MTAVYYLRGERKQGGCAALLSLSHLSDARHCEGSARSNLWLCVPQIFPFGIEAFYHFYFLFSGTGFYLFFTAYDFIYIIRNKFLRTIGLKKI
jgi:hypothetical protein